MFQRKCHWKEGKGKTQELLIADVLIPQNITMLFQYCLIPGASGNWRADSLFLMPAVRVPQCSAHLWKVQPQELLTKQTCVNCYYC
jgi:hypothetical protein